MIAVNNKTKIISLLGILSCFTFAGCRLKNPNKEVYHDPNGIIDTYLERDNTKTIADYSPNEILYIVNSEFASHSSYYTESSGNVNAKKGLISYNQEMASKRWKSNDNFLLETISSSSLVKVGDQAFFKGDNILLRKASKVSMSNSTWENKTSSISLDNYKKKYGESPKSFTHYVLNDKSIVSSSLKSQDETKYVYEYQLDKIKSVPKYQIKMKTNGDLADYPTFTKIVLTLTINLDLQPVELVINEEYSMNKTVAGSNLNLNCTSKIVEKYQKLNETVEVPYLDFYNSQIEANA